MMRQLDGKSLYSESKFNAGRGKGVCEAVILAGGKSSRMGRDKCSLSLGGRTLLVHVKEVLLSVGFDPQVVVDDLLPNLGPIGGVATALQKTERHCVMFLGCDMPFLSGNLLDDFFEMATQDKTAIFSKHPKGMGFPFLIYREDLSKVQGQIANGEFSLQRLARKLSARSWVPSHRFKSELFNINSPEDFAEAKRRMREGNE
ncbi:MAG: molybdenum cofactor guanylyltransferase [Verrucomicrobiota bacterium]|nr:molybdenum cofactor guanylyltransferase [Verrucomicrobiota bacterium]